MALGFLSSEAASSSFRFHFPPKASRWGGGNPLSGWGKAAVCDFELRRHRWGQPWSDLNSPVSEAIALGPERVTGAVLRLGGPPMANRFLHWFLMVSEKNI